MAYLNLFDAEVTDTIREDFARYIFDYSPRDKVIQAFAPVDDNENSQEYSWQLDHLAKPTTIHNTSAGAGWSLGEAGIVGGSFPEDQGTRERLDNVQMIERRAVEVSRSHRSNNAAGVTDEYVYQHQREGQKLLQQVEFDLHWSEGLSGNVSTAARTAGLAQFVFGSWSARQTGGATTFLTRVGSRSIVGATYGSHVFDNGTTPTTPAMAEEQWNELCGDAYADGLEISDVVILCGNNVKRIFSSFQVSYGGAGVATLTTGGAPPVTGATQIRVNQMMDQRSVSMDFYQSDMGTVAIAIDRYMEDSTAKTYSHDVAGTNSKSITPNKCFIGFDPANLSIPMLDPYFQTPLAKTDDGDKAGIGVEFGFRVGNPLGCIGGINVDGVPT